MDYLYALQTLREAAPSFINYFFLFCSEFLFMSGFVVATYIYWCVDKYAGRAIIMGYSASGFVNQIVKNIACVYRPWVLDSRLHVDPLAAGTATGYSFPSGHTASAASIFGGLSIWQKKRKWVVILMYFFIFLVAFSRNWLGAHTMKDVLVSVLIASVVLSICAFVKYWLSVHPEKDTWLCFGGIAISLLILLVLNLKSYPIDYDANGTILVLPKNMLRDCYTTTGVICGAFLGMWLERHFVKFQVTENLNSKLLTGFIGVFSIAVLYLILSYSLVFIGPFWATFIKYFVIFLVILYVYPLIFTYVRRRRS